MPLGRKIVEHIAFRFISESEKSRKRQDKTCDEGDKGTVVCDSGKAIYGRRF